tara:strand:+ start:107 stop:1000 length:894 start_codon:yes stop_codon:yes gene_type:complete
MHKVDIAYNCKNTLGEGITFSSKDQTLYWLDINNSSKLYKFNLINQQIDSFEIPEIITATSIKSENEIILVSNNGINLFNTNSKNLQRILNVENKLLHTRSNDGASDVMGRLWFGTMQNNFDKNGESIPIKKNIGKLYRVDNDKTISIVEDNLGIPNTFVWSPDSKDFYFTDTLDGNIMKYDYDLETGNLSNKQFFAKFDRGFPDGSTMDTDGCLWNCRWGGSCVVRYTPSGEVDQVIEMPVENITNCVFGGKDLKTLFITSANNPGKNQHELDGNLFSINLNYQGLEDHKSKIQLT